MVVDRSTIVFLTCTCLDLEKREQFACGAKANCINRALFVECRPQDCPCGSRCQNQRFQRKEYKPVHVVKTPGKGHGLQCQVDLRPGDFVIEYVGEVVSQSQMQKRIEVNAQLGQQHYYFMTLQSDQILDATRKGNLARFMNHSCSPNCATQKWIVNGQVHIGLFAVKPIPTGTELTFDYKFVRFSSQAQKCLCGEPNCKGFIGTQKKAGDGEEEDVDEAEEEVKEIVATGIDDPEHMAALAKALLRKDSPKDLIPALQTLLNTDSAVCLRRFLALHGLQILGIILGQHKKDPQVTELVLKALLRLPIPNRNAVEDSRLESHLSSVELEDERIRELIEELQKGWSRLDHAFTIPKLVDTRSGTPSSAGTSVSAYSAGYSLDDEGMRPQKRGWTTDQSPREPPSRREMDRPVPRKTPKYDSPRHHVPAAPSGLPEGWKTAKTPEGKTYYYHERTRETRWDPPVAPVQTSSLVEGLYGSDVDAIISRAKAAALQQQQQQQQQQAQDRSSPPSLGSPVSEQDTHGQIRNQISEVVIPFLSRYKSQFKDQAAFKDMARKLTHGLAEKEYRALIVGSSFEMTKQKRQKIQDYLAQYLASHGFKDTHPNQQQ